LLAYILQTSAIFAFKSAIMNHYQCSLRTARALGESNIRHRETQVTAMLSPLYSPVFPESFPSNVNTEFSEQMFSFRNSALSAPLDFHGPASRAALVTGVMRQQRDLSLPTSSFQVARSIAERMTALDQQLTSMIKDEEQLQLQLTRPLMIEQQLGSLQRLCSNPSDRSLIIERELDSLTDEQQQQGRHQPFLARTNNTLDMMSTIEQLLASVNDEQLIEHCTSSIEDGMPTIDQHIASLLQAVNATSPSSCFPSNILTEQPSLEHLQFLEQLQRDVARQAQLEIQAQAHEGHLGGGPLSPELARRLPIPIPAPPFGNQEPFPGKLYRLLAAGERNGNEAIISFTPDGRAIKIHDREKFMQHVIPTYFRQGKISSFVRQLNFYGFEKLLEGPSRGAFAHPFFIRGYPELLVKIERIPPKPRGGSARQA
jgi:hypothetical protein